MRPVNLIIMQNTSSAFKDLDAKIYEFDLKGSIQGRRTHFNEESQEKCKTLKDLNFLEI